VFIGEPLRAFQLDHQDVFNQNIREVLSHMVALVGHCKRCLGDGADATEAKFHEKGTLIYFLQESGAKGIGDLEDSGKYALSQRIVISAFICVHQRPIYLCRTNRTLRGIIISR
jgi:hypothetical protein